jgi:ESS family glutamate:Na+ symporter
MLHFDVIATLAIATLVLALGQRLKDMIPWLHRYNLPAAVIGGLGAALALLLVKTHTALDVSFDNSARSPLMIAFFTTLGFAASLRLLKLGGRFVMIFLGISIFAAMLQNIVGAGLATAMGLPPLFGVLCGSVTLTGGPATGLAFAPQFEQAGIAGAEAIAVAAAMCGIIMGGVMGGPIGTVLIKRLQQDNQPLHAAAHSSLLHKVADLAHHLSEHHLLKSVGAILMAMWLGSWVSAAFTSLGMTLPAYIGAMLVAGLIRNLDDQTGWLKLSESTIENLGGVALSYFLALSLMGLDLSKLSSVALPLLILIAAQVALMVLVSMTLIFRYMGRDYEAAVTATGFYGFMMGTTANAMANMDAFVRRYSAAPRAYLVVPIVGAFFIDFANTLIVQFCLAWLK